MSDLQLCLQQLVDRLPHLQCDATVKSGCTSKDGAQLLDVWQKLLVDPSTTLSAASSLKGQLLSMVSLIVDAAEASSLAQLGTTPLGAATAVLRLLELNPNITRLLQRLFKHIDSPLLLLVSQQQAAEAAAQQQQQQPDTISAQHELLALATLRALQLNPQLGLTWRGSLWFRLLNHELPVMRWVAVRGVSLMLGLSDAVQEQLMSKLLTDEQLVAALLRWNDERAAVALELAQRWQPCPQACPRCNSTCTSCNTSEPQQLPAAKGFVRVCGLEVPAKTDNSKTWANNSSSSGASLSWGKLVPTPSMTAALESAALALCQGSPVVVEGPPGSGKTTLIRALAAATGNDSTALWLHLDDQQDAKSLLGSYSCSAVPGEFVWQMGPLARAVAEGRWVVIEGVDTAPPDILAALLPLLESGVLHIPSRGTALTAAPGFQVLGTVSATSSTAAAAAGAAAVVSSSAQDVLGGLWAKVKLAAPSESEQLMVLEGLYPDLAPLLPLAQATVKLVQLAAGHTAAVAAGAAEGSWQHQAALGALRAAGIRPGELALSLGRQFSTRDLIKWCGRMAGIHSSSLLRSLGHASSSSRTPAKGSKKKSSKSNASAAAEATSSSSSQTLDLSKVDQVLKIAAFTEAADLLAGLVAAHDVKLRLLSAVAGLWCVAGPAGAAEQYEDLAKPNLNIGQSELQVGRAVLPLLQSAPSTSAAATAGLGTFSPTGLALRVMERVGVSLSRGEAVLLVGETGTGKTTTLSQLARLVGANLVAFNMSQQTDSSDLLGGYKPVGVGEALLPLLEPFGELLRKTWKKGNNEEFLSRTLKYAQRKKWSHLLAAYKTALAKLKLDQPAAAVDQPSSTPQQQQSEVSAEPAADVAAPAAGGGAGRGRAGSKGKAAAALDTKPSKKRKVTPGSAAAAPGDSSKPSSSTKDPAAASRQQSSSSNQAAPLSNQLIREWRRFAADLDAAERASAAAEGGFAFAFVEGALVKALKHGWWLLLDEINLAPPEVLERIAGILEAHAPVGGDAVGSADAVDASTGLLLVERGDVSVINRHPGFRLVAAMNPATDAGKRDLPPQLRSRFTEFWVGEPRSRQDLGQMVGSYLAGAGPAPPVEAVVDFYLAAKAEAECRLTDGAGQRPAYSLRSLCRALDYARRAAPSYGLQRALWDGLSMSFLTQLSPEAAPKLESIMVKHIIPGGQKALKSLIRAPPCPNPDTHVLFEQFWLERGPLPLPELGRDHDGSARKFVLTPSVRQQLCNLARCVLAHKHPILLQGPTSSGKTSLVAYLAAQTGHKFVRINNHQHTDLQEYLGSWVPDEQGRLVFREGALVTALRSGHWVVLDELNLAPTEVLEALNRLLDDNRELFVPELQEVVRPHPHFMLFATQNPPGAYAGRKALSRAFRGRFLELHVEEVPDNELSEILHQRCGIAPSYAAKMVTVMRELQRRRQRSNVFAGRHGFITPRDLFRWAERGAVGYESLAVDGFMVLGERLRSAEERAVVVEVLEQVMRVNIDMEQVYQQVGSEPQQRLSEALAAAQAATATAEEAAAAANNTAGGSTGPVQQLQSAAAAEAAAVAAAAARDEAAAIHQALTGMVWTRSMKRLYTLVDRCLHAGEPVLLVGETGTGKTSVCQLLALMRHTHLHVLNCNQHTETSDILGGFRPTRTRERDIAAFRATARELLSSPGWQLTAQTPPAALAAAAAEAASPMEIEDVLQTLLSHLTAVQAVIRSAVQIKRSADLPDQQTLDNSKPTQITDPAAAALARGDLSVESLQRQLDQLSAGVAALRSAAAAARAPFGWEDGPLVVAMRKGELLLVDELNLAEDAVLERLNSVLEPGRSLTLAEKGGGGAELVIGAEGFQVLATMNPGGDFGKKELSPALSNRFTQIWVPAITDESELGAILESRLAAQAHKSLISSWLLDFWKLFVSQAPPTARGGLSVRDLLAWVGFINATASEIGSLQAYVHGAYLTLLDGLGLGLGIPAALLAPLKARCRQLLQQQLTDATAAPAAAAAVAEAAGELQLESGQPVDQITSDGRWGIKPFFVAMDPAAAAAAAAAGSSTSAGSSSSGNSPSGPRFNWQAPTTCRNAFRLLRAMQLGKAVLLEGSPGVGKTSLVAALCRAAGAKLVRINCSEHTDMIDLLGADLPAPGGAAGQFAWCDGPLLSAVKAGHWVLLDELNLAGQSVLEGLNGLLDHRQALFVPELGQSFKAHQRFRLFAAQNPLQEGGGRKGLPKSFLNRFTRVAVELLQAQDLRSIAMALHPQLPQQLICKMVDLLSAMQHASSVGGTAAAAGSSGSSRSEPFAVAGGPWEFNLRDLLRWCELVFMFAQQQQQQQRLAPAAAAVDAMEVDITQQQQQQQVGSSGNVCSAADLDAAAEHFIGVLFSQRLRTESDRQRVQQLFKQVWGRPMAAASSTAVLGSSSSSSGLAISKPGIVITPSEVQIGMARMMRTTGLDATTAAAASSDHKALDPTNPNPSGGSSSRRSHELLLPSWQAPLLESAVSALSAGWMVLLVGPGGSGKTSLARLAAAVVGVQLQELALTQGTDTSDLLGSFEQVEPARKLQELSDATHQLLNTVTQHLLLLAASPQQQQQQGGSSSSQGYVQLACDLQELWDSYKMIGQQQQQQQQGVGSSSAAGGDSSSTSAADDNQTVADTVRQLKQLHLLLQRLNRALQQTLQHTPQQTLQQQALDLSDKTSNLIQQLDSPTGSSTAGRFEWVDGSLTRAIQQGTWVLLDNANLVNPTVLDRLNGLLEPHGVLQLDEAGSGGGRVVVPHPGFRLILAYDPKHGEVSRAMRNRGVELCLLPPTPGSSRDRPDVAAAAEEECDGAEDDDEQQQLIPAAASTALNPSWSLSGHTDLETLLSSTGVPNSLLLAAMAAAHTRMAAACAAAHRKAPGLREAKTWAVTAGVLLQQGRCLGLALWGAWVQVYMRGFAATAVLVAEGESVFRALCGQLEIDLPHGALQQNDVVLPLQQQQHGEDKGPQFADHDASFDDVEMLDQPHQQQNAGVAAAAAVQGLIWPNQLLRPCQWPIWLGYTDLAQRSTVAAAVRDVSLPVWLLAQAVAAEVAAAGSSITSGQLLQQLPAAQRVLLSGAAASQNSAAAASLSRASGLRLAEAVGSSISSCLQRMPELVLAAAAASLCRHSPAGSSSLKQLMLQHQLAQVAAAAAAIASNARVLQLAEVCQQVLPTVVSQSWHQPLQLLLQQQAGPAYSLLSQQQQNLPLLLPILQQAACHAAVAAAAAAAAPAATAAGAATPYQESVWRAQHPSERARSEASHPVIDGLKPALAAAAEVESAALQIALQHVQGLQDGSDHDLDLQLLQQQIQQLQLARSDLWDAVHGPMYLHYSSAASSSSSGQDLQTGPLITAAVVTAVQPERVAWSWSHVSKAVTRLLDTQPGLIPDQSHSKWSFLAQQMAAALQLDDQTPRPLLWQLGGHPQLPPSRKLLAAQQKAAALANALAANSGTGFRVDPRGQPAALAAAGLDWQQLLLQAIQAVQQQQQDGLNDDAHDQDILGPVSDALAAVTDGLDSTAAADLRERLAAAAAAVLCCDLGFRRSVTQGLALLGFVPHMQLLRQQHGSSGPAADVAALAAVPESLQQQAVALLIPVLAQIILAPQSQQQEATGAAAVAAAAAAKGSKPNTSWQVLPARSMVSVTARMLQLDLQQLVHAGVMQQEAAVAQQLLYWVTSAAAAAAGPAAVPQRQQQLQTLGSNLGWYLQTAGPASCQRSAAALVPYHQLSWLISSLIDNAQQLPQQQLMQQVLPGLLHEAWYRWHSGLWAAGGSSDLDLRSHNLGLRGSLQISSKGEGSAMFGFYKGLAIPSKVVGSPLLLHLASRTAAVLQICAADAADGSSKAARLQQLSLAVQQLQHQQQSVAGADRDSSTWASLGLLLGQILLAHMSSFTADDAATLQQLVQQLVSWCSSSRGSKDAVDPPAAAAQQWLSQLSDVLSCSSHSGLVAVSPMLLLPCAEAIVTRAYPQQQSSSSSSWYQKLGLKGWCWLLLGCARLQLVAPPPGVDPAGKFGYNAKALNRWINDQLDPMIQVYVMMQQLPAGPDESAILQGLHHQREGLCNELRKLRSQCVPRPDPPQYMHLQQEVTAFSRGLADTQRVLAVGKTLLDCCSGANSRTTSAAANAAAANPEEAAAVTEAEMWEGSAAAWADRMQSQFADYVDILQPVLLAVLEIRHGMSLLAAASQAAQQVAVTDQLLAAAAPHAATDGSSELLSLTAGLLSFPPPLATAAAVGSSSSGSSSTHLVAIPASVLAQPQWQKVTGAHVQQQQQEHSQQAPTAASSQLADFSWQIRAVHAALVVAVQEQLAAGAAAAAAGSRATASPSLSAVDSALQQLLHVWSSVRAYEAQAAEEAAQLFKHKTKTATFLTEEEEDEATYKQQYPDYYASFADLADTDDLSAPAEAHAAHQQHDTDADMADLDAQQSAADGDDQADPAAAATAAQARSAAAKSLLEGQLLQDVVMLHQQLYTALAMQQLQHGLGPAAVGGSTAPAAASSQQVTDAAREQAFQLCFSLGQQLVAAQQGLLPAELDQLTMPGSVMALALQHRALNTAAAPTAAATASTAVQLDMQQPFVEEASLMQQPLAELSHRLTALLEEWPEHPLLQQLLAIVQRLLALPLTVPLKQALTGLELLLARAQVWEETAAKHVSLKQHLTAIAGIATRWRKLELASWKGLLERVKARHAGSANKSWYHLYQLLVLGITEDAAAAAAAIAAENDGSSSSDAGYRRVASLVEAFVQTATVGEYAARLQLLHSFACQLTATAANRCYSSSSSGDSSKVASMLWNVLLYYSQFLPAISAAIDAGLVPLSKELTDFVKLAKWEDRGYYAMKVSTEKAQRQLHRLSRRAEDYLKQPAAAVLAQASQALGLGQITAPKAVLAAAAAAGKAAAKAAKAAAAKDQAAAVADGVPAEQQQKPEQQKESAAATIAAAAAAAAEVDPAMLAELEPEDTAAASLMAAGSSLEVLAAATLGSRGLAAGAAGPADTVSKASKRGKRKAAAAAGNITTMPLVESLVQLQQRQQSAWDNFTAAVLQSAATPATDSSTGSSYIARAPKLTAKMAKVLAPSALQPTTATADAQQQQDELQSTVPALRLDDLAATAASRSLALSTDSEKGARLRKKKALTDMLHALGDAGFSKRASDVPASDRDAAAWFSHQQPCLAGSPLLLPGAGSSGPGSSSGVDPQQLQLAASCWFKAGSYYYKALARLQRLQAASTAPHKDLARHEALAVVSYTQHQLYLMRQQRQLVGELVQSYTQLVQVAGWLQEVAGNPKVAEGLQESLPPLPPQQQSKQWLETAQQVLTGLAYHFAAAKQLVAAVIPMQQQSGRQQHVISSSSTAATKLDGYVTVINNHKAAVEAESAKLSLAGCPVVTHAAMAAVAAAFDALCDLQQDAAATTAQLAAAARAAEDFPDSSSDVAVVCGMVPTWDRALDMLAAAAQEASRFQQQQQQQVVAAAAVTSLQDCEQQWSACLDQLVPQVLVAAQALQAKPPQQGQQQEDQVAPGAIAATPAATAADGAVSWTAAAVDTLKPARLSGIADSARKLLSLLASVSDLSQGPDSQAAAAAMSSQAAALLPLLQLLLSAVQRSACDVLVLHKSLGKLSYVCSSIFCSLMCQGYCMPEGQEGEATEGDGQGELQWQDAGGTGMGEGTGKKDVSDQIQNEDQLLGAQQKDQQQQQQQADDQAGPEDDGGGVEMDADFDGSLHDIDDRRQQQGPDGSSESEAGDDDRIDQQMGEVGENEERVDERLWGDDDDNDTPQDKQQQQGKDDVDRQQQLSVQDKSNLEYAGGGEDDQQQHQDPKQQQQQGKQDDSKPEAQQQQQHDSDAEDEQQQQQGEGEGDDEAPAADVADDYQQQHKPQLQQQDQEFELPEEMNLDGQEEDQGDQAGGPEDQGGPDNQAEQQQQQQEGADAGQEQDAADGDAAAADADPDQQQQQQQDGEDQAGSEPEGPDDGPDMANAAAAQPDQQQPEDGVDPADGDSSKRAQQQQGEDEQPDEQQDEDLEAVAAHGAGDDEGDQPPEEIPQAGPQGVASAAAAPQAQAQGAADQQQHQPEDEQQQQGADTAAAMDWEDQQTQQPADQAQQAALGAAGATDQGQIAPVQQEGGGQQHQQDAGQQQQRKQRRQQQPDLNPFRNLGDALERWRADLAVQHEAAQQQEDESAAAAADLDAGPHDEAPTADEYQFLGQNDQQLDGTTQALAPATEEQAAQQEQQQASMQQPGQADQGQQQQEHEGDQPAQGMDEDAAAAGDAEADLGEQEQVAAGAAPQVWSGKQQKSQQQQQQKGLEQASAGQQQQQEEEEEGDPTGPSAAEQQQQLLDDAAEDAGELPSLVAAKLAATQLAESDQAVVSAEETQLLTHQLPRDQAEALRAELDALLREAAAAAASGAAAAGADRPDAAAAAAYGRDMWGRCEALVSGLAGELTEQLRLILEPTLASRLGGEFRSGKRLNMKRVIGYIASQFRRDKIWMRRSRPDKRRYQVVVAVDDSRSMAETGAGSFALEALALLCKAMSRLEVGEVGVISYGGGGGVQPLQPLEVPFTDAAGPQIMSALRFDQDNMITDRPMLQLVEAVQHLLELARHRVGSQGGGSSSDLRQLLLVLGDGRFHEKEALLGAVRQLVEVQGVCPVFIALDTSASSSSSTGSQAAVTAAGSSRPGRAGGASGKGSSLLDMQSVKFVDGKPVFERYLDSFPFPYYIVLRDIAALPATLADLLRQWFELNASST